MNVSRSEHAMLTRLANGPATYVQLGEAAGIKASSAGTISRRHLLRYRPVLVTYHTEIGTNGADILCLTDAGRAVLPSLKIVDRRGQSRVTQADLDRTTHLSDLDASIRLRVSVKTIQRARARAAGR
jgi:hypothetical protein